MAAAVIAYLGYAFAAQGWMMYVVLAQSTFIFALTYPSMNALASQQIPANAQGELQGAVACLYSLSSIFGPPLMTQIFGYFSSARAAGAFSRRAVPRRGAADRGSAGALFAKALRLAPAAAPDSRVLPEAECSHCVHVRLFLGALLGMARGLGRRAPAELPPIRHVFVLVLEN